MTTPTDDILTAARKRLAELEAEAATLRRMLTAADGASPQLVPVVQPWLPPVLPDPMPAPPWNPYPWQPPLEPWVNPTRVGEPIWWADPNGTRITCGEARRWSCGTRWSRSCRSTPAGRLSLH